MTDETIGPVWVTKYALSRGITKHERAKWCRDINDNMISVVRPGGINNGALFHKPDWHISEQSAIEWAEKVRDRKIKSLTKQVAKLRALTFEVKGGPVS